MMVASGTFDFHSRSVLLGVVVEEKGIFAPTFRCS